jgi:peptidyl-prolyl cis-trans isomerase B (cyclophilin B)
MSYQPQFPQPGQPGQPGQPFGGFPQKAKTNGLAIAALVCSFFCGLLGIILGIVAIGQINKTNEGGKGLAIAGIVIGAVSILFTWMVFFASAATSGY